MEVQLGFLPSDLDNPSSSRQHCGFFPVLNNIFISYLLMSGKNRIMTENGDAQEDRYLSGSGGKMEGSGKGVIT